MTNSEAAWAPNPVELDAGAAALGLASAGNALAEPPAVGGLRAPRPDLSLPALRSALHYFSTTVLAQDDLIARRRGEMGALASELAGRCAEIDALHQAQDQRDAEIARLAHALAQPSRLRRAVRHPLRALRHVLRRVGRMLRPLPATASPRGAAVVTATPRPPQGYRDRMRARIAGGVFADVRSMAVIVPPALREAGAAIERCLLDAGLRCAVTVGRVMPEHFSDDIYVVLEPAAFARLPPADQRILWQVDPAASASAPGSDALARLSESLAIFEASLDRIQALQIQGIALQQTFYVPLDPKAPAHAALSDDSPMGLRHLLARALHGCGVLDDAAFDHATRGTRLDAERIVLCLPEALARFEQARQSPLVGAMLFPGIRQLDGWKGTALSYRYLAQRALAAGRTRLIVSEDDAAFEEDFNLRLDRTLAYLDAHAGRWDLFSGLLTDLSAQAKVTSVDVHEGELFLRLDSVIGMVFGIYGPRALEALAAYRITGNDTMKHTIDRYLELLKPSCVTLFPPLVRHDDGVSSTLWPGGQGFVSNEAVNPMIHRSQERLLSKVADWMARGLR